MYVRSAGGSFPLLARIVATRFTPSLIVVDHGAAQLLTQALVGRGMFLVISQELPESI
jgi:hypothetical protein